MRKITEVLRLKFEAKLSHDQVARAAGLSKGVVGKYVSLAKAQGLSWPLPEGMDEAALESLLYVLYVARAEHRLKTFRFGVQAQSDVACEVRGAQACCVEGVFGFNTHDN